MNLRNKSVFTAVALSAGLGLTACGSGYKDVSLATFAKSVTASKPAAVVNDPNQIQATVDSALESLDGPLALASFEKTDNNVVLFQIAQNGRYKTWTSWSNGEDRRSITTRNGVITSTRGLRNDLMSSDVDRTLSLISTRSPGSTTRVQRYLDGENQIVDLRAECHISRGGQTRVQIGAINRVVTEMTEDCQSDGRTFRNVYRVDSQGRIIQSVQWLNEFYGVTVIQALR